MIIIILSIIIIGKKIANSKYEVVMCDISDLYNTLFQTEYDERLKIILTKII